MNCSSVKIWLLPLLPKSRWSFTSHYIIIKLHQFVCVYKNADDEMVYKSSNNHNHLHFQPPKVWSRFCSPHILSPSSSMSSTFKCESRFVCLFECCYFFNPIWSFYMNDEKTKRFSRDRDVLCVWESVFCSSPRFNL